jgi:hypothetical protein
MSVKMRELDTYLVVKPNGMYGLTARVAKRTPSLEKDEVAIKVNLHVPDTLFSRPQLQASITIPDSAVTAPVVNAQVLDNVREILEQQTGMDVRVSLVEAE